MNAESKRFTPEQLLDILSLSKDATAIYSGEDMMIQSANDAMIGLWGKSRSVIGKPLAEALPELEGQPFFDILRDVWKTGKIYQAGSVPAQLIVNGRLQTFYFDFTYKPIRNKQGKMECIINTATDVTELRLSRNLAAEAKAKQDALEREQALNEELAATNEELTASNDELRQAQDNLLDLKEQLEDRVKRRTAAFIQSEGRLRNFFEQAPLALCILNGPELIIELVNDKILGLWGKSHEIIGQPYKKVRNEPELASFVKVLGEVYRTGIPYIGHETKAFTNGNWGYFNFTYQPVRDEQDKITGILVIAEDVTTNVLVRQHAATVNDKLSLTVAAANMGSWTLDNETKEFVTSPRLKELFGFYGNEKVTFEDTIRQITGDYRAKVNAEVKRVTKSGGTYEITYSVVGFHDGSLRWLRAIGKVSKDGKGDLSSFTGISMDVTEQVKTEEKIKELNEELAVINEELRSSNEELREAGEAQRNVNDELGTLNEMLTLSQNELQLAIEAASLATFDYDILTHRLKGNDMLKLWFGLQPEEDIEPSHAKNMIAEEDRPRVLKAIQQTMDYQSGGKFDIFYTISNPANPVARVVRAKGKALFNKHLQPVRFSGILQDVTEQKRDEQRKNDFIAMVSHELKTPLTSLSAFIQILQMVDKGPNNKVVETALEKSFLQVKKMTTLINGFLNVSRLESGKIQIDMHRFDMADLVKETEKEIIETNTTHTIIFAPVAETFVIADRDKIGQVINNFITNAIKYSPMGSTINIACITVDNNAQVSVTDEGRGIAYNDIPKLFDRYYRVEGKEMETISGFGIGLYISAEIINRHNGKIWVKSEPGKGSVFYFTIPAEQQEP